MSSQAWAERVARSRAAEVARAQSMLSRAMARHGSTIAAAAHRVQAAAVAGRRAAAAQAVAVAGRRAAFAQARFYAATARSTANKAVRRALASARAQAARARDAVEAALERARERRRERTRLRSQLVASFSAHQRLAYAAVRTAMAVRLHVDHSPPPRDALTTTPRTVRGPNSAGRPRLVVVRPRELPTAKGIPRFVGVPCARPRTAFAR